LRRYGRLQEQPSRRAREAARNAQLLLKSVKDPNAETRAAASALRAPSGKTLFHKAWKMEQSYQYPAHRRNQSNVRLLT
jgi:hypothetical protein